MRGGSRGTPRRLPETTVPHTRSPLAGCMSKRRYRLFEDAALAAASVTANNRYEGATDPRVHAYWCSSCRGFHVGHAR